MSGDGIEGRNAMGMTCYYFRTDEDAIWKIREGNMDFIYEENKENLLDIDKSWHAIHFTLTGCAYGGEEGDILSNLVFGGEPINEKDMGCGPARLFTKEKTAQLSEALKKWDKTAFCKNFNVADMLEHDIYPVMSGEDDADFFTYVWTCFDALKEFFQKAAEERQSVLTFIS